VGVFFHSEVRGSFLYFKITGFCGKKRPFIT